jgi:membrane protease subunit (stomatin/prohibitin family)
MVALGGLTLALSAAALWRVIDPLTRNALASAPDTRAPHRIRELEREKQAVLKAIKEIELDYQMRKISQADYRDMVERYRTRALRVMGDLAAGDDYRALIERELKDRLAATRAAGTGNAAADASSESSVDAGVTGTLSSAACGTCATPNDSDAQYCKRCGQKLTSSDVPA